MVTCVYRRHGAVSSAGSTFSARICKSLFVIFSSFLPMSLMEKLRFGFLGAAAVAFASAAAPSAWASYVREYVPSSFFFRPGPGSKVTSVAAVRAAQQHMIVRRMARGGAAAVWRRAAAGDDSDARCPLPLTRRWRAAGALLSIELGRFG